jgi:hypothetical protein
MLLLVSLEAKNFLHLFYLIQFTKYNHFHDEFFIIRCSTVVSCVNKYNRQWIKDAQMYLVCALICSGKIFLSNSTKHRVFCANKCANFLSVYKLLWN